MPTGENTIGRTEECDVCIAAKSLSHTHATLLVDFFIFFFSSLTAVPSENQCMSSGAYICMSGQC